MVDITIEELTKSFDGFLAVDSVNLQINHGEFFTLVGPSGCGKTTTLRMLAGLETPTNGDIRFDGEKVTDLSPQQRDIAMVFQNIALYPHMTNKDNIGYGLKVRGETENYDEKIHDVAELLGITDQLDKKPGQLSGGQRQRVALGRAIVREPNVILMDEPMSDLDAKLKAELRVKIKEIHNELDTTMVYVTHDQEEAMTMSTRIGLMRDGNLAQVDSPERLFHEPRNEFVAQFIGQPQMNMVTATVMGDQIKLNNRRESYIEMKGDAKSTISSSPAQEVQVGFRPRDATLTDNVSDSILITKFNVYEPIGKDYIVDLVDDDGKEMKIVTEKLPRAGHGDEVGIEHIERLYIFDQSTGDTVTRLDTGDFTIRTRTTQEAE